MQEQLVLFATAKLAKEKGFDEKVENAFVTDFLKTRDENIASVIKEIGCTREYDINTGDNMYERVISYLTYSNNKHQPQILIRPTQSLLQKWIREVHYLHIVIIPTVTGNMTYKIIDIQCNPEHEIERPPYKDVCAYDYKNYESALEAGLQEALKLI